MYIYIYIMYVDISICIATIITINYCYFYCDSFYCFLIICTIDTYVPGTPNKRFLCCYRGEAGPLLYHSAL